MLLTSISSTIVLLKLEPYIQSLQQLTWHLSFVMAEECMFEDRRSKEGRTHLSPSALLQDPRSQPTAHWSWKQSSQILGHMPPLQWSPEHLHREKNTLKGSEESREYGTQAGSIRSPLVTTSCALWSYFKEQLNIRYLPDHPSLLQAHRELFQSEVFTIFLQDQTWHTRELVIPYTMENVHPHFLEYPETCFPCCSSNGWGSCQD